MKTSSVKYLPVLGCVLFGATLVGIAAAHAPKTVVAFIVLALMILSSVALFQRFRHPILLLLLASGAVDLPSSLRFGPISAGGVLTLIYASIAILVFGYYMVACSFSLTGTEAVGAAFLLWALFISILRGSYTTYFVQTLAVLGTFYILVVSVRAASTLGSLSVCQVDRTIRVVAAVSALLAYASFVRKATSGDYLMEPRAYALLAPVCLAWLMPYWWRYHDIGALCLSFLVLMPVAIAISRMGLVLSLAAMLLSAFHPRRALSWARQIVMAVVVISVVALLTQRISIVNDRVFGRDASLRVGPLAFNGEGRARFWQAVYESFRSSADRTLFGQGVGSSQEIITSIFGTVAHPHNDYLRLLHDTGVVGTIIFMAFIALIFATSLQRFIHLDQAPGARPEVYLSACISLFILLAGMLTDNILVYFYVMVPISAISGLSLGLSVPYSAQTTPASVRTPLGHQRYV